MQMSSYCGATEIDISCSPPPRPLLFLNPSVPSSSPPLILCSLNLSPLPLPLLLLFLPPSFLFFSLQCSDAHSRPMHVHTAHLSVKTRQPIPVSCSLPLRAAQPIRTEWECTSATVHKCVYVCTFECVCAHVCVLEQGQHTASYF